jgi:predicted ATPase
MKRFILTGAPGAGKTAIIRQMELDGFSVVEEAATDIHALEHARGVAEPWKHPSFIDSIVELQKRRQLRVSHQPDEVQFHDRSAVCTAALAVFLGYPFSDALFARIEANPNGSDLSEARFLHRESRLHHPDRSSAHQFCRGRTFRAGSRGNLQHFWI